MCRSVERDKTAGRPTQIAEHTKTVVHEIQKDSYTDDKWLEIDEDDVRSLYAVTVNHSVEIT